MTCRTEEEEVAQLKFAIQVSATSEDLQSENTMSTYTEQNCDNDGVHTTETIAIQALVQFRTNYDLTVQSETENRE